MAIRIADQQPVGERELLRLVGQLLQRVRDLERRVQEHEEWLTELSEDLTAEHEHEALELVPEARWGGSTA